MTITFRPASQLTSPQLTELFNAGYNGYAVPVNLSQAQMRAHAEQNDIDLDQSLVAFNGDEAVGLALLARRGQRGWVGGLGVVASRRRQGLGRALMERLLEAARSLGLTSVQLEVLSDNTSAHTLYRQLGFEDTRELLVISAAPTMPQSTPWPGRIEPGTLAQALAACDRLHVTANPWQRRPESLMKVRPEPAAWLALRGGEVAAYAVGAFTDERLAFQDVGASEQHPDAMAALLAHLHAAHPQARGSLVNLDERDPAWPAFEALGYRAIMRQHEMRVAL